VDASTGVVTAVSTGSADICYKVTGPNPCENEVCRSVTVTSGLPVELISFQANCTESNTVDVTWSTASEHNSSFFRVDKSRDGEQWEVLGSVDAAYYSTELIDYGIIDYYPALGMNYYRLTQYDTDNFHETFEIKSATCNGVVQVGTTLNSHPNPSGGDFSVDLHSDEMDGAGLLLITDSKGSLVYSQNITITKGTNSFLIHKLNVQPGMYFISVKSDEKTVISKHSLR
jgi:hypothetical protein